MLNLSAINRTFTPVYRKNIAAETDQPSCGKWESCHQLVRRQNLGHKNFKKSSQDKTVEGIIIYYELVTGTILFDSSYTDLDVKSYLRLTQYFEDLHFDLNYEELDLST